MSDIVKRLHAATLDKDNMPRMDSERAVPVGLAKEAADEVEWLTLERDFNRDQCKALEAELRADNERLMLAIRSTASDGTYDESAIRKAVSFELAELIVDARRALESKP